MQTISKKQPAPLIGNTDTSLLKVIALLTMLMDHAGAVLFPTVYGLRIIGRMAFPLYAWCLVVGCVYTSNIFRYGFRLLLLAMLSQPLYMIALHHNASQWNILLALGVGVLAIGGIQQKKYGSQFWAPLLGYLFMSFVTVDYGWKGLTFILLLYFAKQSYGGLLSTFIAFSLFWGTSSSVVYSFFGLPFSFLKWEGLGPILTSFFRLQGMIWIALPLIAIPTHSGLRLPKWLGYALYPLHLIVLIIWSTFI